MTDLVELYGYPIPPRDSDPVGSELWRQAADLCVAARLNDPLSIWAKVQDGDWVLHAQSASRGFVPIGSLKYFPLARIFMDELEAKLEPFRSGAEQGKQRRVSPKVARAKELDALGLSETAIARRMLEERLIRSSRRDPAKRLANARKSVHRWLNAPE